MRWLGWNSLIAALPFPPKICAFPRIPGRCFVLFLVGFGVISWIVHLRERFTKSHEISLKLDTRVSLTRVYHVE